ncbi:MAG: DNA repair protein RecO [Bacteroidota bacterium]
MFKTRGITLKTTKYGDTSLILPVYTENFGFQTYILKGARSARKKGQANILLPLSILDMEVYHSPDKNLQQIKEFHLAHQYKSLHFHHRKQVVILLLAEILTKLLRNEEPDTALFTYLESALLMFDNEEENFSCFHIHFLIHLTKYIGFFPDTDRQASDAVFDLKEACFTDTLPDHPYFISGEQSSLFSSFQSTPLSGFTSFFPGPGLCSELLDIILLFYKLHVPGNPEFKSPDIFKSLSS